MYPLSLIVSYNNMPDEGESYSQTVMRQIHYMTFPHHHAVSNQEEAQLEGEGQ
jgi:hypothetical protein